MTKNTKILLGVAVLGVGGYFFLQSKKPKSFANYASKRKFSCPRGTEMLIIKGGLFREDTFLCKDPRVVSSGYSPSYDNKI
jgi:hypothetical protein